MKRIVTLFLPAALVSGVAFATPAFMKLGDIKGEVVESEHALLELKARDPAPVALLLPAVQKVREVAARLQSSCQEGRGFDACASTELSRLVLASDDGRDPALSLLDLYAQGTRQRAGDAKASAGRSAEGRGHAHLWAGIIKGLEREMRKAKMPPAVVDPIVQLAPKDDDAALLLPAVQKVRSAN